MADLSIGTTIGGFAAYHAGNYFPTKADVGLNLVNNWGASDSYTTASSTTYATSKAVKDAYDAAIAAVPTVTWSTITGKPTTFTPASHTHTAAEAGLGNVDNAKQLRAELLSGYWGMVGADGSNANWIRTTVNGIIPHAAGGASSLGTSSWPFNKVYASTYYEGGTALASKYAAASHNHDALYFNINRGNVTDFNAALSDGVYGFGSVMTNSPRSGTIYGRLVVYVSDGGTHNNSNNWIWQEYMDTAGYRYYRYKVNAGAWTAWVTNYNGNQKPTAADVGALPSTWVPNFSDVLSKPTTLTGYGITDALSISGNEVLPLVNADVMSASLTTSTTTANQVVDSFSSTIYRTVKYLIQANFGTSYHSSEALMIHDGTTASLVVYGDVMTGSSLMSLDADVSDGNVRLLATPANVSTTIKIVRTSIDG